MPKKFGGRIAMLETSSNETIMIFDVSEDTKNPTITVDIFRSGGYHSQFIITGKDARKAIKALDKQWNK